MWPYVKAAESRRGSTPGSAPIPPRSEIIVDVRWRRITLCTEARNLSIGLKPANVGRTGGLGDIVGAEVVECMLVAVGLTAITGRAWDVYVGSTGDNGGCAVFASGSSRSGVRDRPSSSLKLFSRG